MARISQEYKYKWTALKNMRAVFVWLSMSEMGDVVSIDPILPDTVEQIRLLEPDMVIVEHDGKSTQFSVSIYPVRSHSGSKEY